MFDGQNNTMMGGYQYQGMAQPVQKFSNPLSPDQIKKLQQQAQQFSLAITEEEMLRGICNHRNAEGTADTLVFDPLTGEARCTICGYKFKPIEANVSPEELKEDVERIVDILQTIKLMYIDLPADAAKEYFPIIPLVNKIPQLFEFAAKNMTKHESYNWQYNNRNMGAINMFNNLQSIFGGAGMPMGGYQQPQQFAQPMGMGQPMMQPMGYPMNNGFGYPGASMNPAMMGYAPQSQGFQYTPGQDVTPVAPSVPVPDAPAATDAATVTQKVTV